jgi:hypothetical protein
VWERIKHLISHNFELQRKPDESTYPFRLSIVNHSGLACAICPWNKFCVGCPLTDAALNIDRHLVLGIDWNLEVLKMYFSNEAANHFEVHASVQQNRELQDYPISLVECLELFGREEELEEFYCRKCKEHRSATKTLSLFKLPPLMCIHLKRFQEHRGRWEKTNKIVQFPLKDLTFPNRDESFSLYEFSVFWKCLSKEQKIGIQRFVTMEVLVEVTTLAQTKCLAKNNGIIVTTLVLVLLMIPIWW